MSHPDERLDDHVEVWADADLRLGEGARWIDDRLVFTDILTGRLFEAAADQPAPPKAA
jgi:hypothetical protein